MTTNYIAPDTTGGYPRLGQGWRFLALTLRPQNEGHYEVLDKHGWIEKLYYGRSNFEQKEMFFGGNYIKASDIIAWREVNIDQVS